jgi:O-succinylbenzoate synthase
MNRVIVVDYESLGSPSALRHTKNVVIEYVYGHPETLIIVSNAISGSKVKKTSKMLMRMEFPCDGIICNPLAADVPEVTFKVMVASKFQQDEAQETILVVDQDPDVLQMWQDSGVPHIYRPELEDIND